MSSKHAIILFVSIATLIICAGHAGLYASWIHFFSVASVSHQSVLAIVLAILSLSFIGSSFIVYFLDTIITDILYRVSAVWLGFVWYAALAAILTWVIVLIQQITNISISLSYSAAFLLCAALIFTAYGYWNAQHPIVRNIKVRIPNLPGTWKGKRIAQLSDIHLGPVHKASFLADVVLKTNEQRVDVVCITGDLFDGGGTKLTHLVEPLRELQSTFGTLYITGNHETYVGLEKTFRALKGIPLTILRDEIRTIDGVQFVGIDYPLPGTEKDLSKILTRIDPAQPSICLFHEPKYLDDFDRAGINLLLAGHTHKGQLWPFGAITKKVYKEFDYGLHKKKHLQVYTSSGIGTWGPPLRTGNKPEIVIFTLE